MWVRGDAAADTTLIDGDALGGTTELVLTETEAVGVSTELKLMETEGAGVAEEVEIEIDTAAGVEETGVGAAGVVGGVEELNSGATQRTCRNECQIHAEYERVRKAYLADVKIRALDVDLRVVLEQHSRVDAMRIGYKIAIIIGLDDVGVGAVLANQTQAENLIRHEIVTALVYLGINSGELVAG